MQSNEHWIKVTWTVETLTTSTKEVKSYTLHCTRFCTLRDDCWMAKVLEGGATKTVFVHNHLNKGMKGPHKLLLRRTKLTFSFLFFSFYLQHRPRLVCELMTGVQPERHIASRERTLFLCVCSSFSPPVSTILLSHELHQLSQNPESTWWDQTWSTESNMFTCTGTSRIPNTFKSQLRWGWSVIYFF